MSIAVHPVLHMKGTAEDICISDVRSHTVSFLQPSTDRLYRSLTEGCAGSS